MIERALTEGVPVRIDRARRRLEVRGKWFVLRARPGNDGFDVCESGYVVPHAQLRFGDLWECAGVTGGDPYLVAARALANL